MNNRISKLYEGLNNHELAALAFECLVNRNITELKRISSAVPRKTYTCSDMEYGERYDNLYIMSLHFRAEYWKLLALRTALIGFPYIKMAGGMDLEDDDLDNLQKTLSGSKQLALDKALQNVCAKYGIKPELVYTIASAEPFNLHSDNIEPDEATLAEMEYLLDMAVTPNDEKRHINTDNLPAYLQAEIREYLERC